MANFLEKVVVLINNYILVDLLFSARVVLEVTKLPRPLVENPLLSVRLQQALKFKKLH